jgi:hypothetical protein
VVGKERNSQILVNLLVTNVPRFIGSITKTLGLKHLQFPEMGASSALPDCARVFHHRTEDLLVQQNTIPDGQNTPPVRVRSQHYEALYRFFSHLIDMS